jgi:hypothetical protein
MLAMTDDDDQQQQPDEQTAQLLADAQQQVQLPALWGKFHAALERERVSGPIRAAHYAGGRAYHIAHTAAERDNVTADEAHARGTRAFWTAYFIDLAEEATVRAASARDDMRRHGDPDVL